MPSDSISQLLEKVDQKFQQRSATIADVSSLSQEEILSLIHALQVYQIELEMQNDEFREAQNELETSRDKYSDLYEFAPVAYLTISQTGLIKEANLTCTNLLKVERRKLIGQRLSRFVSPEHQDAYYVHHQKTLKASEPQLIQINMVRADGTRFCAELKSLNKRRSDQRQQQYRVAIGDITDRVTAQKELQKTFNQSAFGFLADSMSHDINNILTVVFANLQTLRSTLKPDTPEYKCVTDAWEAALNNKKLTAQLSTIATDGTPNKEATSIEPLIIKTIQLSLSNSKTQPEYHFSPDLLSVLIDKSQMSRVIQNLVLNADQAMPQGGKLIVSAENVTVPKQNTHGLNAGTYVKVCFTDEGVGMSESVMQHIFDPYFTTKQAGHGLGLSIVSSIISRHEGHIDVQSQVDGGTTFELFLPTTTKQTAEEVRADKPLVTGTAKILLMDDEQVILNTLSRVLKGLGYSIDTVLNGTEALHAYQTAHEAGKPYHIVIMDLIISTGMGGRETIAKLHQKYPKACVIATSGYLKDPVMEDCKKFGFEACLHKPIDLGELTTTVNQLLENKA